MAAGVGPNGWQLPPFCLAVLLLAAFVIVGLWDAWAAFSRPDIQSVSEILYQWGREWPVLTVLVGMVIGHLFWPVRPR